MHTKYEQFLCVWTDGLRFTSVSEGTLIGFIMLKEERTENGVTAISGSSLEVIREWESNDSWE